ARQALGRERFVFPASGAAGYVQVTALAEVAASSEVSVSAHDLRRTFATVAEAADVSPLQLKAMMNHAMPRDVTSGYVHLTVERLREPAQRVGDRMKELCGIEPAAGTNVVEEKR